MYIDMLKIAVYLLCCLNDFTMQYYRIYSGGWFAQLNEKLLTFKICETKSYINLIDPILKHEGSTISILNSFFAKMFLMFLIIQQMEKRRYFRCPKL